MSARAGIVVTGTEVLTGIISDRNGPWLADRLRERGVELAFTTIVADRPDDVRAALEFLAARQVDLIITTGGLGPTADDLTAEIVADFAGRPLVLDAALEGRIAAILEQLTRRWPGLDPGAISAGNRKQATIPSGATVLEPVGTAPGLVVPPAPGRSVPTVLVLPGPPGELQPMWKTALETEALSAALADAGVYERRIMRLFGIPESEIAKTLREVDVDLSPLEITTCLRRGEIEIATTFAPSVADTYAAFEAAVAARHGDTLFSTDGATVDDLVAAGLLSTGWTVACAESCTGGLLAGRLTDRAGSSEYVLGGLVVYANSAKVSLADVEPAMIESFGAVSPEVAIALAAGARSRFGASVGVGITGVAGPGGGSEQKPVGTVCFCVSAERDRLVRTVHLPGGRYNVRDRAVTVAMHLLLRLCNGERDPAPT